jgi:diadenosine tetraphosphatase ApaH/serine/threonine PP2A family protein phosphatase
LKELRAGAARRIHGEAAHDAITKEYRVWRELKRRCYDSTNISYHNYGARGISVCQRWLDSYPAFLSDMGRCPLGHSLDRIDNNGDYSPTNCRWASRIQQANNTRVNRVLTLHGVSHTLAEWSRLTGIRRSTITQRIDYYGWSIEEALSTK